MSAPAQVSSLARRSILRTVRQPAAIIPALFFPLIFLALINGGARASTNIPGFPTDSYLAFALAATAVQGALLGGINAGAEFALDIESGFLSRLTLTPIRRPALLVGHLAGSMAVGAVQGTIFIVVGTIFDVDFAAGIGGAAVFVALVVLVALAFSAIGAIIAIRTASSEAVQSVFPLFFIVMSFSSFFMPRDLISKDWFRWIATANPASYIIEAGRSVVIAGWDAGVILTGFAAAGGLAAAAIAVASRLLSRQVARV